MFCKRKLKFIGENMANIPKSRLEKELKHWKRMRYKYKISEDDEDYVNKEIARLENAILHSGERNKNRLSLKERKVLRDGDN